MLKTRVILLICTGAAVAGIWVYVLEHGRTSQDAVFYWIGAGVGSLIWLAVFSKELTKIGLWICGGVMSVALAALSVGYLKSDDQLIEKGASWLGIGVAVFFATALINALGERRKARSSGSAGAAPEQIARSSPTYDSNAVTACSYCSGIGTVFEYNTVACGSCGGSGAGPDGTNCMSCLGSGQTQVSDTRMCPVCGGRGTL